MESTPTVVLKGVSVTAFDLSLFSQGVGGACVRVEDLLGGRLKYGHSTLHILLQLRLSTKQTKDGQTSTKGVSRRLRNRCVFLMSNV